MSSVVPAAVARKFQATTVVGRLLELAEEQGLTKTDIGKLAGGKHPYQLVQTWVRSTNPKTPSWRKLDAAARGMGSTAQELVEGATDADKYVEGGGGGESDEPDEALVFREGRAAYEPQPHVPARTQPIRAAEGRASPRLVPFDLTERIAAVRAIRTHPEVQPPATPEEQDWLLDEESQYHAASRGFEGLVNALVDALLRRRRDANAKPAAPHQRGAEARVEAAKRRDEALRDADSEMGLTPLDQPRSKKPSTKRRGPKR